MMPARRANDDTPDEIIGALAEHRLVEVDDLLVLVVEEVELSDAGDAEVAAPTEEGAACLGGPQLLGVPPQPDADAVLPAGRDDPAGPPSRKWGRLTNYLSTESCPTGAYAGRGADAEMTGVAR